MPVPSLSQIIGIMLPLLLCGSTVIVMEFTSIFSTHIPTMEVLCFKVIPLGKMAATYAWVLSHFLPFLFPFLFPNPT